MSTVPAPALDVTPLLALLEQRFGTTVEDSAPHGVPHALWERALLGPLREFLSRPGKELRARVCGLGFTLGGGEAAAMPPELPLLVEALHAGSLIVDDIEDGSSERRGRPTLHRLYGVPLALNAGNWLYFWPQVLLASLPLPPAARLSAHERVAECLLRCHEGQALDLALRVGELPQEQVPAVALALSALKTGELIGLAAALGAIAARADDGRLGALGRFGRELGVGLQMLDDLSGVCSEGRRDKGREDLRLGRVTWVWGWLAQQLDAERYRELLARLGEAQQGEAAACDALLAQARFRLGMTGVRGVRRHFDAAVGTLEREVGGGAWASEVRAELAWIERRFLEAT